LAAEQATELPALYSGRSYFENAMPTHPELGGSRPRQQVSKNPLNSICTTISWLCRKSGYIRFTAIWASNVASW